MGEVDGQLRERWERLCDGAGTPAVRQEVFDQLMTAYRGSDRHYHSIAHITECLGELDSARQVAGDARAVEAAVWFHDAVYDGGREDNEERSADLAVVKLKQLGFAEPFRKEVHRLILLTRHEHEPPDNDGKLLVDIDLASLARPREVFEENTRMIRREYPKVTDADFARGRRDMLGRFLKRPRIYYTDVFRDRYEQTARENLSRAMTKL